MTDVDLFYNETLTWIFSRLNVKIWRCNVDPIGIVVQTESQSNQTEHLVENPEIVIHNSSFSSLDLNAGSKAQITDCYINAQFKPRPTLITANNSDVSIQNCHFVNFINEKDASFLYGHYYSHVIIENSVFIQHNSSKGVLFLQNNCYMFIINSTHSHNVASSPGYSAISLKDRIYTVMMNTVFSNNSALRGGAVIAIFQCKIALTNCTFSSNKAFSERNMSISKNPNLQKSFGTPGQNTSKTVRPANTTLFNQTSSDSKKHKVISAHLLRRKSVFKKYSVQQEDVLPDPNPGYGGAIFVVMQSELLVTNCSFEDNSAQSWGGAILTAYNTTVHVQKTTFFGNKAQYAGAIDAGLNATLHIEETTFEGNKVPCDGGAINIEQHAYLRMKDCLLDNNISQRYGGAITVTQTSSLDIQETNFTRNRAVLKGEAIEQQQAHLQMKDCVLDDNISEQYGGAIAAALNATLQIQATHFTGNIASQGGVIDVYQQSYLYIIDCTFKDNRAELDGIGGAITATVTTTLDIQKTNFTGNSAAVQGGAIDIDQQSYLRIKDCIFEDNSAEQLGGAITGSFQAVLEISGSYFSKNQASDGGAMNTQQQVNLSLTNCRFEYNFAQYGGAIMAFSNVILKIQETNFTGIVALDGAALYVSEQTDCHVVRCLFNCNTVKGQGGAVYMDLKSSVQVENTILTNNTATEGGAIYIDFQSKLQTNMCSFWNNFGKRTGGAIILKGYSIIVIESCHFLLNHAESSGALDINYPEHVSMLSTSFLRNVASYMVGAIAITNGTDVIINNITCVGNRGRDIGCLYIYSVTLTLTNSNISENFANSFGAGVSGSGYSSVQVSPELNIQTRLKILNLN